MQELQFRGLPPDVITYNAAISVREKVQKPQQAPHLLQELQRRGPLLDVITYNAAISPGPWTIRDTALGPARAFQDPLRTPKDH